MGRTRFYTPSQSVNNSCITIMQWKLSFTNKESFYVPADDVSFFCILKRLRTVHLDGESVVQAVHIVPSHNRSNIIFNLTILESSRIDCINGKFGEVGVMGKWKFVGDSPKIELIQLYSEYENFLALATSHENQSFVRDCYKTIASMS